jgi:hypothetical protein
MKQAWTSSTEGFFDQLEELLVKAPIEVTQVLTSPGGVFDQLEELLVKAATG